METVQIATTQDQRKVWGKNIEQGGKILAYRRETYVFAGALLFFEIFLFIIYGIWIRYDTNTSNYTASATDVNTYYFYQRDVAIMIFFGFGFLMTFLRKYAYSALGYTFLFSALAVQWAIPVRGFFEFIYANEHFTHNFYRIDIPTLLDALFCAGAVMITYGAVLGRTTPLQMLIITFVEVILYFLNTYIGRVLGAFDVGGGMYIHLYGAYFGLAIAFFLTYEDTKDHPANGATYISDQFAMAGTFFLWLLWPSFNAAVAPQGDPQLRAIINTFVSELASVFITFVISRLLTEYKFEMVHIQNSTLAGGVVMGVMAHLNITPVGALACGTIAGGISVIGYVYFTPFLTRHGLQDTAGVNNLHGIPGFIGSIGAVFAALQAKNDPGRYGSDEFSVLFPAGNSQPGHQVATVFIVLGIALVGGTITAIIVRFADRLNRKILWFEDTQFWEMPHAGDHGGDPFAHEAEETTEHHHNPQEFVNSNTPPHPYAMSNNNVAVGDDPNAIPLQAIHAQA